MARIASSICSRSARNSELILVRSMPHSMPGLTLLADSRRFAGEKRGSADGQVFQTGAQVRVQIGAETSPPITLPVAR